MGRVGRSPARQRHGRAMDTPLHDLARRQHGVLLASQARELGWTWDEFHELVRDEGWTRPFRNAYFLPTTQDSPLSRARALQLMKPNLVAALDLAAAVHGFALVRPPLLSFNAVDKSRYDIPGGRLVRWLLRDEDVELVDGIRVTGRLRTAVDLLRDRDRDSGVIAVDSALRLGAVHLDAIADELVRLAGEPGVRRAWRAFPILDPKAGSPTESKVRLIMWDRKVYPQSQVHVVGPDGENYYLDFVVDGVAFEAEGSAYHGGSEAHEGDVTRFNALGAAAKSHGYDWVRVTFRQAFGHPEVTGKVITRAIAARRRRLSRQPLTIGDSTFGSSPTGAPPTAESPSGEVRWCR